MVTLRLAALLVVLGVFLAACGGEDNGGSQTQTPTRQANSGPTVSIAPRSGPPGTEVTVSGSGWPANVPIEIVARPGGGAPYRSVRAAADGSFSVAFRLEKQPDGSDLNVGPFNLIVRSDSTELPVSFQVETRRPLDGAGPGG